jgi:hypothetical protein
MSEVSRGEIRGQEFEIWTDSEGRDHCYFPGHPVNEQVVKSEEQPPPKSVSSVWRKYTEKFGGESSVDR